MSHQTGIKANKSLKDVFADANVSGRWRLIKVAIENEELICEAKLEVDGTSEDDYDAMILPHLDEKQPTNILYRLDSKDAVGYEWLFIAWSPDFAPTRQKMLYAGTRSTLKTEFGAGRIKDEMFGTIVGDVNLLGYKKHLRAADAPQPLTMAEQELKEIQKNEVHADIHTSSRSQTMQGVQFPISEDAIAAVLQLQQCQVNYIQLCLDLERETTELVMSKTVDVHDIIPLIPTDAARYHLFLYDHTHEGDQTSSIVFIYSMPGYQCPIKERMLYSSCKAPLISSLEEVGLEIAKKIEVSEASELTEEFIYDEVHPKKNIARTAFAKPKGPAGRGPKRVTRPSNPE